MTHLPNQTKVQCKLVWLPSSQPPVGASSDILGWSWDFQDYFFSLLCNWFLSVSSLLTGWQISPLAHRDLLGCPGHHHFGASCCISLWKLERKNCHRKKNFQIAFLVENSWFWMENSKCINLHFKPRSLILSSICTGKLSQNHSALRSFLIFSLKLLIFFLLCTW